MPVALEPEVLLVDVDVPDADDDPLPVLAFVNMKRSVPELGELALVPLVPVVDPAAVPEVPAVPA